MSVFRKGFKDGIPIGLGYFAVSFSLGIAARNAGMNWFHGALTSLLCIASAGEYAAITVIKDQAPYYMMALMTLVANARYLLMSCAFAQRISPDTGLGHRVMMGFGLTDEIFGISIARPGYLQPPYTYGAIVASVPLWTLGTALGIIAGNLLPSFAVSALSVALFGMFLAIIIPPARENRIIAGFVVAAFILSFVCSVVPWIKDLSEGTRIIILTVILSCVAAYFFPVADEEENADAREKRRCMNEK